MGLNDYEYLVNVKRWGKPDRKSREILIKEVSRMRAMKSTQKRNFVGNPELAVILFCFVLSLLYQRKTRAHFHVESWVLFQCLPLHLYLCVTAMACFLKPHEQTCAEYKLFFCSLLTSLQVFKWVWALLWLKECHDWFDLMSRPLELTLYQ
jgi:hypothetical protein